MVELARALSSRVVAVADAGVAVLGPAARAGGVLRRLPPDAAGRRRSSADVRALQGAEERLHALLPRPTQLPLPGESLFSFSIAHSKCDARGGLTRLVNGVDHINEIKLISVSTEMQWRI